MLLRQNRPRLRSHSERDSIEVLQALVAYISDRRIPAFEKHNKRFYLAEREFDCLEARVQRQCSEARWCCGAPKR